MSRDPLDADGDKPDWIELYNQSFDSINLKGWSLTDNRNAQRKWRFTEDTMIGPGEYLLVFASGKDRTDPSQELHTNFSLKQSGEYLGLIDDTGSIASEFEPSYPEQFTGISFGLNNDLVLHDNSADLKRYYLSPTPGGQNASGQGAVISQVEHRPHRAGTVSTDPVQAGDNMLVTATVRSSVGIRQVMLDYRIGFGPSIRLPMLSQGNDRYAAVIPSKALSRGTLVHYSISARDQFGYDSYWPLRRKEPTDSPDFIRSPQYLGTVIGYQEMNRDSQLPIFHWYVEEDPEYGWEWFRQALDQHRLDYETRYPDPNNRPPYDYWTFRDKGTSAVLFYRGQLYDNVSIRLRGKFSLLIAKKSYKVKFNRDYHLHLTGTEDPDTYFDPSEPFDEINLKTLGLDSAGLGDQTYLRALLAWRVYEAAGLPVPLNFPIRTNLNGAFFGVFAFIEELDERYLTRNQLNPDVGLFKVDYNDLGLHHIDARKGTVVRSNTFGIEQKRPQEEIEDRFPELVEFIAGINVDTRLDSLRSGQDVTNYIFKNVDVPILINYLAARTLMSDWDAITQNFWLLRNGSNSGRWLMLPWDNDYAFPFEKVYNHLLEAVFRDPLLRTLYLHRLSSLMDRLLGPPTAPQESGPLSPQSIQSDIELMQQDITNFDMPRWGMTFDPTEIFQFIEERRRQLYDPSNFDSVIPLNNSTDKPRLYFSQLNRTGIGKIDPPQRVDPDSEDQMRQSRRANVPNFVTLINCSAEAVDLSGWTLQDIEGQSYTFPPGTVLLGYFSSVNELYLTDNMRALQQHLNQHNELPIHFVVGDAESSLISPSDQWLGIYTTEGQYVVSTQSVLPSCRLIGVPKHSYVPLLQRN